MPTRLFPTTVIGSLPRPAWVREIVLDRKAGRISEGDADRLLDRLSQLYGVPDRRAPLKDPFAS